MPLLTIRCGSSSACHNLRSPIPILPFLVLLSFIAACGGEQENNEGIDLRLRLKTGDRIRLWSVSEQSIRQTMVGEFAIQQRMGLATSYEVTAVDSQGVATMRVRYDSLAFLQDGAIGKVVYTSADTTAEPPPLAAGFAALVGEEIMVRLGPDGRVLDVTGVEEVRERISRKMGRGAGQLGQLSVAMGGGVSREFFKTAIEQGTAFLPGRPVKAGESWSRTTSMQQGFPLAVETTYRLASADNETVTIEMEGTLKKSPDTSATSTSGFIYDLAGTQEGELKIDRATGWITESESHQELSGTFSVRGASPDKAGRYPVTVEGTSRISVIGR